MSQLRAALALSALALAPSLAQAQAPGEVLSLNKISKIRSGGPTGLRPGDQFGRGSDVLGDLDGDGVVDFVVGAPKDDGNTGDPGADFGAVWILFMNSDGTVREYEWIDTTRGAWSRDLDEGDEFGRTVAGIGDQNGDGTPDLAVGACYDDDNGSNQGAVYIFFLAPDGSILGEQKISESAGGFGGHLDSNDQFGRGIVSLGDLDGDGIRDLAVGATGDDDGYSSAGAIWILFMNVDGTVRDEEKISQTKGGFTGPLTSSSTLGFDLINLGDLDGDGVVDIASGAPDTHIIGPEVGALYVIFLKTDGTVKDDVLITMGYGGFTGHLDDRDEFTACICAPGDIDGDGIMDIAVGAGKDDDGIGGVPVNRGAVWILFMNPDGTVRAHQKISELEGGFTAPLVNHDRFGTSLAAPGDFNGDGVPDLLVGARFDNDGGNDTGAVYLLRLTDGVVTRLEAEFSATSRSGLPPLEVQFTDESEGAILAWDWDFGDGGTSTEANPTYTYENEGTYSVTLTVTDAIDQTSDITKANYIIAGDVPPAVERYGCGMNPVGSLTIVSGEPQLGTTMVFGVDNPLGTQPAGSRTVVFVCNAPELGYPCGVVIPGKGMDGGDGERLVDMTSPNPLRKLIGSPFGGPGNPGQAVFQVPPSITLVGMQIYCQGYVFDASGSLGVHMGLTDALKLTLF